MANQENCRKVTLVGPWKLMMITMVGLLGFLSSNTPCRADSDREPTVVNDVKLTKEIDTSWLNNRVLATIEKMPVGGGYAVDLSASKALGSAIGHDENGNLEIKAARAKPNFCSGAVYLVLLESLKPEIDAIKDSTVRLKLIRSIDVAGQSDGTGIWGRWNSNGPCMAMTFAESGLGKSFWGYKSALPGDFLKLWWTEAIGRDEAGHSVVFLGFKKTEDGEDGIEIWSANKPGGYGKKVVALSRIKHSQVSRCDQPHCVAGMLRLSERSDYLAGMLRHNTTPVEIDKQISQAKTTCNSSRIR